MKSGGMEMFGRSALSSLVIALLCFTILSAGTLAEASGTVKLTAGVKKTVLANGLTILVKESKANDVVVVRLDLKMGARFEGDREAGISRLLQQSLLKGTKTRTAEQIAGEIESAGGRIEVGTGKEVGYIQLTCTAEGLEKVLDVLFDVILNPVFPGEEVNKERDLQVRRIRERKDQLLASTADLAQEALYGSHPFHKPAEGYEETVASLGREQVLVAYGRFYRPENMVMVAVGNLNSKRFVREVEKRMGALKGTGKSLAAELPAVALGEPRTKLVHRQSSSAWIIIAYPAPGPSQKD